jgi:Ulp1 family protease
MSKYWTKKDPSKNLFEYDHVMIPINLNNNHWSLVTVDLINKKFLYYDSLENNISGYRVMNDLTTLFTEYVSRVKENKEEECGLGCGKKKFSDKYEEEATNKLSTTINSSTCINNNCLFKSNANSDDCQSESESDIDMMASFWKFKIASVPKQTNGYDCGVFMCKIMDYLARDELINFTQDDIKYFRYLMGREIMEGKLLTM